MITKDLFKKVLSFQVVRKGGPGIFVAKKWFGREAMKILRSR
jgi:hypothetical protein